ncbi:uncharacterized protein V6R79_004884 [Siganus canaliculatus]
MAPYKESPNYGPALVDSAGESLRKRKFRTENSKENRKQDYRLSSSKPKTSQLTRWHTAQNPQPETPEDATNHSESHVSRNCPLPAQSHAQHKQERERGQVPGNTTL